MKKNLLFALAAAVLTIAGCSKGDLEERVDNLESRVTTLEEQVKYLNEKTVPGLQATVAAIQAGVQVTSVTSTTNGYTIVFSNGTTAVITNGTDGTNGVDGEKGEKGDTPVISAKEVDGVFYWTADGEFLLDADGNKIPVHATLPQFRINQGKWQVTYDEGKTWTTVETMGSGDTTTTISIEDGTDTVTFWIGDKSYVIEKETAFYISFEQREDIGVPTGYTISIPYTISGVKDDDVVEVDVLNVMGDWKAEVVATDSKSGVVKATNNSGTEGKIFVYAANGRGKTDIKSLCFEEGVLTAVADVKTIPAEGGEFCVAVTTNMDYNISATNGGTSWLSIKADTKAVHTDSLIFVAAANTAAAARTSTVSVINPATDSTVLDVVVLQEGTAGTTTKYEDYLGTWLVGSNQVTVAAKEEGKSYTISGLFTWASTYGSNTVEALYDEATSNFVIMEQALGDYQNSSYGTCTNFLTGLFSANSKTYLHYYSPKGNSSTPYALFNGNIDKEGNIECSFGYCMLGTQFVGYAVRWIIQSGTSAGAGNYRVSATTTPLKFSKIQPASEDYKAWLGQWTVTGANNASFTINVEEKLANFTYTVTGWQGNYSQTADYDTDTKSIVLNANSSLAVATNKSVKYNDSTYVCSYYYNGYIAYNGATSRCSGTYPAAAGTIAADGTATLTGKTVKISSGTVCDITRLGLTAIGTNSVSGTSITLTMSGYATFPCTMTRPSSSSSVKTDTPLVAMPDLSVVSVSDGNDEAAVTETL